MGEATFRVPAPAVYDRIRLRDGEVAWLRPDATHLYSLDGECWYLTADGSPYVQRGAGSVRLEAPRGGGWLYTTQPMLVRLAARGASFVPYAPNELVGIANPVDIGNLPPVWAAGMPVVETIYDSGSTVWTPAKGAMTTGVLDVRVYERVWVSFGWTNKAGLAESKIIARAYGWNESTTQIAAASAQRSSAAEEVGVLVVILEPGAPTSATEAAGSTAKRLAICPRHTFYLLNDGSPAEVEYDARIVVKGLRRG